MSSETTIYRSLLSGNFILPRQGKKHSYCVYDQKRNPLIHVNTTMYRLLYPVLKKDKSGKLTLNLTKVRQLHGNNLLKKEYRFSKQKHKTS